MTDFMYSDNFVGQLYRENDEKDNIAVQQINGEVMYITVSEYFFDTYTLTTDDIIYLMEKFKDKYTEDDWSKVIIDYI